MCNKIVFNINEDKWKHFKEDEKNLFHDYNKWFIKKIF